MKCFFLLLLLVASTTMNAQSPSAGKALFEQKCARCHGKDGARGFNGAANLRFSNLNDRDLANVISNGKNRMPAWKKKLTPEQIGHVIAYLKTLRQTATYWRFVPLQLRA